MPRLSIVRVGLFLIAFSVSVPSSTSVARAAESSASTAASTSSDEPAAASHGAADKGHDEEAHAKPNILEFKPSLMVSTVVVFGLLLAILWKFAWGPLSEALSERERKQEDTLRAAEDAKSESARLLAEHKRQMETAAEQVRQILEEARRQADANAMMILQKAQAEAELERDKNKREISTAKDQALAEIWSKTADLAVSVAGKVLGKEMSHDDHRRLVDSAIGELPSANGYGGGKA